MTQESKRQETPPPTREQVLRGRRREILKSTGGLALIMAGACAMSLPVEQGPLFAAKIAGGVIFLGLMLWPTYEATKAVVKSWRGDDLKK